MLIGGRACLGALSRGWPAVSAARRVGFHTHAPSTQATQDSAIATARTTVSISSPYLGTWRYVSLTLVDETDITTITRDDRSSSHLKLLITALAPCIAPWPERRCQVLMIGPHVQRSAYSGLLWIRPTHGQPGSSCTISTLPDFQGDEAS